MKKITLFFLAILGLLGESVASAADIQSALIRLRNKRTPTYYLTTTTSGQAIGAVKKTSGRSQVWLINPSGSGYILRSAETAEYLQADFSDPSNNRTTLYVQVSPNDNSYYNISSKNDFSGNSCLNLNGSTLYEWAYSGDAGSDWAIEPATDVSEDDVAAFFASKSKDVRELKDGGLYRIISFMYGLALTEGTSLSSKTIADDNYSQYWRLIKNGSGWNIQSVTSDKYVQHQTQTSSPYQMGNARTIFNINFIGDKWETKWNIYYGNEWGGLHTASTQSYNVVYWDKNAEASSWIIQEADITEEDLLGARYEEEIYNDIVANKNRYTVRLAALFKDRACTELKDEIQALSDEELSQNSNFAQLNEDMKAMVLKVKNNTWQQFTDATTGYTADYERFFRIADYPIYSNHQDMASKDNFQMSNYFGRLSGPTGIVADLGQVIYVYVNANPKTNCTLALEAVSTDGVAGNHPTGEVYELKQGLNVFRFSEQKMLYIFHQLDKTNLKLADYPPIQVHIEGGQLNGYWDATRGMTNADWKLLQQDLLKAPFLNLKTKHLVFQMDAPLVKAAEPNEMEGLMRIWEMIPVNEDSYMGVEDFEGRYNNIWNVFSGASSYMHSTTYGTWYTESTIPEVMNYNRMRQPGTLWGPSHEIGHNHQNSINVIGATESSNNLFSNINRFEQGIQTSRRQLPPDVFDDLAKNVPWPQRTIWQTTSMYFQLYLYFHAMHHDDNFYPNLFRTMRKKPLNKGTWNGNASYTDSEGEHRGAYVSRGALDYLHLAKMICDVAQADLSEFFEAYGMFIPVENYHVGDYANYIVTTTQADIDAAKEYMKKYPKKLGNLMFIDDHIGAMKAADPNNKFEGQPAANGKRVQDTAQHDELNNGLPVGDVGDYEDFDGHEAYDVDGDYFTISSNKFTFRGTGYVGHKFYDLDGNLIWATNAKTGTLPTKLRNLGPTKYVCFAAQQNMEDVPCPYYNLSSSKVYRADVHFGNQEDSKAWWGNATTDLSTYLPENAIAVVYTENAPETFSAQTNVVDKNAEAQAIVINGNLPFRLPIDVHARNLTFNKTIDGVAALNLPFAVTSADIPGLQTADTADDNIHFVDATEVPAGSPALVNGSVSLNLTDVQLTAGTFLQTEDAQILSADGKNIETVETASPFTYLFNSGVGVLVPALKDGGQHRTDANSGQLFDLSGRRLNHVRKPGLYISDGHKVSIR